MIVGHRYFFHTIATFTNLSLGVICKIIRSRDHLSSFRCTGIGAYNGKTKFRPSSLLLTNDITFDWFAILWLVKRSVLRWPNFYHRHTPVLRKDFKWLPHKATFTNLSLGVICKIIWSRDHLSSFRSTGIHAYDGKTKFWSSTLHWFKRLSLSNPQHFINRLSARLAPSLAGTRHYIVE